MSRSSSRGFFARLRHSTALPGVAPITEFESLFLNECARVERNGRALSLLVYTPTSTDPAEREALAEILRARLRPTDAIGEIDPERLGVLLPETTHDGAWSLAEDLLTLLARKQIKARCEVFCHPFTPTARERADAKPDSDSNDEPTKRPDTRPLLVGGGSRTGRGHARSGAHASTRLAAVPARASNAQTPTGTDPDGFARAGRPAFAQRATPRGFAGAQARSATQVQTAPRSAVFERIEGLNATLDADPTANFQQRLDPRADETESIPSASPSGLRAVRAALGARPVGRLDELFIAPLPLWKRAIDVAVCSILLPLLAPILAAAALAVRLTSPGPVIFAQRRAGPGGKPFTIYKFRSMYIDAEARRLALEAHNEASGPVFKIRADPRITPVGKFIRKSSIDELPQLWNVLKGDMTLVGPRPPMLSEIENYQPWQRGRLNLTGGITCIWQVSGRSEIGFIDWVRMDLRYARQRGFLMDLSLLARTFSAVFSRRGAY